MPGLWTYPWDLYTEGLTATCEDLDRQGATSINVAAHYHSVRSLRPRTPDELFAEYRGGCYVPPDSPRFDATPVEPSRNAIDDVADPLGEIVSRGNEFDLETNAWVVCQHNTTLGVDNPGFRIESAFGDAHDHSLCPSYAAVRGYFGAIIDSISSRGVDEIHLESIGYPSAFHPHGRAFGHDKRHVLATRTGEALLSQCFCPGCAQRAKTHAVDLDAARDHVRGLLRERFTNPDADHPSLDALLESDPLLRDLFDFRQTVITEFVATLADAAGDIPLNYYVMEWPGLDPDCGRPAGVSLPAIEQYLDRVTALCYVSSATEARDRIRRVRDATSRPVDAGVTLDPDVVDGREEFETVVSAVRAADVGTWWVYHHGLLTDAHLDWVQDAFTAT